MNLCDDLEFCIEEKFGLPIIYAYENSDIFYAAKLLSHGERCLCFATEEPIERGLKIYVLSQKFPLESENFRIFQGCFAQVEDCKKFNDTEKNLFYLIRGGLVNNPATFSSSNDLREKVLKSEMSYL